jgi:hypothetical protein
MQLLALRRELGKLKADHKYAVSSDVLVLLQSISSQVSGGNLSNVATKSYATDDVDKSSEDEAESSEDEGIESDSYGDHSDHFEAAAHQFRYLSGKHDLCGCRILCDSTFSQLLKSL